MQEREKSRIAGIVMASGFSRRIGKNKLMLPFRGEPLIAHVLRAIEKAAVCEQVLVVAVSPDILQLAKQFGAQPVLNHGNMIGQSASIRAGIEASAEDTTHYMFFAGDQPLLSAQLIQAMAAKADKRRILVAAWEGKEGLPSIFPRMYRESLLNVHGDSGGKRVKESYRGYVVQIPASEDDVMDIDTSEDYAALLRKE